MNRIVILLIYALSVSGVKVVAQSEIDSLTTLLATTSGEDKVDLYGKICWRYLAMSRLDIARQYADSMGLLAAKLESKTGQSRTKYYYGTIARVEGNYKEALNYYDEYVQYNVSVGDSSRIARVMYQIGAVQSRLGNYDQALKAYYRSLAIDRKANDAYGAGITLNSIGIVHWETKKYKDAIREYLSALAIFDSVREMSDKTDALVNLGNVYSALNDFEKAKQYYKEALAIDRREDKKDGIAVSLANVAFMFDKQKQYDSALRYHLMGLAIREELSSKEDLARSLAGVGYGYLQLKNYPRAEDYLNKALAFTKPLNEKPVLIDIYEHLSRLNFEKGNYLKAYEYQQLRFLHKDSVLNEANNRQLNDLQAKYETEEKDQKITLLSKENEVREKEAQRQAALKNAFIAGLILVSLLVILVIYIFRQRLKNQFLLASKNEEIKEVNFKRQLSELEMKALRAQINPHFLFNCMNSINKMILNGETENASQYLAKFSKLVRLILENAEGTTVSLENELALLESYIQLEELRFKGKIGYNISVDKSIEKDNTYLPSMVLQPFVENAIWHGLMHKENDQKGMINIDIKEQHDRLLCTIEDNGVGREKAQQLREKSVFKNKSMGMKITEERLRLLSQEGLEQLIRITDLKDALNHALGTRVEINIPLS
ncbi:MAG TPA: tetratricopeptide repeat protein [Chryseolinea sp.]